jgi:hypothetical protein
MSESVSPSTTLRVVPLPMPFGHREDWSAAPAYFAARKAFTSRWNASGASHMMKW